MQQEKKMEPVPVKQRFHAEILDRLLLEEKEGIPLPKGDKEIQLRTGVSKWVAAEVYAALCNELKHRANQAKAPDYDPELLPKSWKDKYDSALKKGLRELQHKFQEAVKAETHKFIEQHMIPEWKSKIQYAERIKRNLHNQKSHPLSRDEYKKILVCLHPDRVQNDALKARFSEAFEIFKRNEIHLATIDPPKSGGPDIPNNAEEIINMKRR
jgi:hypothetical protein